MLTINVYDMRHMIAFSSFAIARGSETHIKNANQPSQTFSAVSTYIQMHVRCYNPILLRDCNENIYDLSCFPIDELLLTIYRIIKKKHTFLKLSTCGLYSVYLHTDTNI